VSFPRWPALASGDADAIAARGAAAAGTLFLADAVVRPAFDLLIDEVASRLPESETIARAAFIQLIAAVLRSFETRESARAPEGDDGGASERAIALMRANLERPLAISAIARAVGLSPGRLHALFVARHHLSPSECYRRLRLARAKELLRGDSALGAIARELGFASAQHFIGAFKRGTGLTPGAWRDRALADLDLE
jgi:transcriptional regulator GlxA family with amidase domain